MAKSTANVQVEVRVDMALLKAAGKVYVRENGDGPPVYRQACRGNVQLLERFVQNFVNDHVISHALIDWYAHMWEAVVNEHGVPDFDILSLELVGHPGTCTGVVKFCDREIGSYSPA